MQIANPIYDVVFKYLMEDSRVAKFMLTQITGENILDVSLEPQENFLEKSDYKNLSVYRLDFRACIKTKEGKYKTVLIEIQKAKYPSDIMRFRRYLGSQYANSENTYTEKKGKKGSKVQKKPMPLITIYFLGYHLEHTKAPIIKVARKCYDLSLNKEILIKEEFIEALTHNSFIIQIPYIKDKYKTDLDLLLSFFDQKNKEADQHILNIDETLYPKKYQDLIRRLQRIIAEPVLRRKMNRQF